MEALQSLATEFSITVGDATVWLSIGQALLFGAVCLVLGIGVARLVGLLEPHAPAGEALGVGLGSGLLVLASWWAAIVSGGRSVFTPVAVGFAVAVALALARWIRRPRPDAAPAIEPPDSYGVAHAKRTEASRRPCLAFSAAACSSSPSPSCTARRCPPAPETRSSRSNSWTRRSTRSSAETLPTTGTETIYLDIRVLRPLESPDPDLVPLGRDVAGIGGHHRLRLGRSRSPKPDRAARPAARRGRLDRDGRSTIWRTPRLGRAYAFGFIACLVLAPIPLIPGRFFTNWAVGLVFGITLYGLAAVAVLLALYSLTVLGVGEPTWALAVFVGSSIALDRSRRIWWWPSWRSSASRASGRTRRSIAAVRRSSSRRRAGMATHPGSDRALGVVATVAWGFVTATRRSAIPGRRR